jgi:hypothetical protein
MKKYKVITIAVSSILEPWITIENEGIRKTWLLNKNDNDLVLFYYGGVNDLTVNDDRIYLPHPEGFMNIGHKTIMLMEYILKNYDFDYVFKTNTSSYIDLKKLNEYVDNMPLNNLYSGVIGDYNNGNNTIRFVSGCGVLLSKDMVELYINNKNDVNHNIIEDVAMGDFFNKKNIKYSIGPRIDINFSNENNIPLGHFHYRCKDYERNNRNNDIKRMHLINKRLGYE